MLVLDTDIAKEFCETLEVLGPTHATRVLRFVIEVLKNAKAMENDITKKRMQLDEKNEQISCLMRSVDELQEEANEAEGSLRSGD